MHASRNVRRIVWKINNEAVCRQMYYFFLLPVDNIKSRYFLFNVYCICSLKKNILTIKSNFFYKYLKYTIRIFFKHMLGELKF